MFNTDPTPQTFEAYLFGSPEFRRDGEALPQLAIRKITALLAYLILHTHRPHSREKLAARFWGDVPDRRARHSLRTALANIRRTMGHDLLVTDRKTAQLDPELSIWVDARELQRVADAAAQEEMANLQYAIDLYRGDLLADFYDEWILRERDHYRTLYLDLLLRVTQVLRSRGDYASAIEYAQRALRCDPANERAHQHVIFCRLASGDRSAALRQYEACRRLLGEELGAEPSPETTALYRRLAKAPADPVEARITNLPIPLTSFIGRAREMARVKELLNQARLVTLTGPGGCGKTRLAIQVASDVVDAFREGVWWVDFAPLMDASLVPQTIARVLGIHEATDVPMRVSLENYLRHRNILLVLDNCEHLVDAVAELARTLLLACADVTILTTSREALGVPGEMILCVPSLSFPTSPQLQPSERLEDYESVRLLAERAAAVKSDFVLSAENASAVTQICRRLEGMPLAIELAAARVKVLSVHQIAARLDDRLSLLTASSRATLPRHKTLRAVIDWSWTLLSEQERVLLSRSSVFVGGWTLAAAEAVSCDAIPPDEGFDLVASLVDKSLVGVVKGPGGEARYRMLETVRQYGLERLGEAGQVEAARERHARFFADLAERAEEPLHNLQMRAWLEKLEIEHDNLRAALAWSLAHQPPASSLRFAAALGIFWRKRGYLSEGRAWLERLLAHGKNAAPQSRARALAPASWLARDLGEYRLAAELQEEALELLRAAGDKRRMIDVLIEGGLLAVYENDPQRAFACFEECLALSDELGYPWGRAMALVNLAHAALFDLQWDEQARSRCEEALELFRALDDQTEQAHALIILGAGAHYDDDDVRGRRQLEQAVTLSQQAGDRRQLAWATTVLSLMNRRVGGADEAAPVAKEGLRLAIELGERTVAVFAVIFLALLAKDRGHLEQAIHLISCAIAYGESFGHRPSPYIWDTINADLDAVRAELGEDAFAEAWDAGAAMSFDRVARDALKD
ncbi:MAG: BTAD domain-containing putative transcriptional regulator [Anaerolineae bacterium]